MEDIVDTDFLAAPVGVHETAATFLEAVDLLSGKEIKRQLYRDCYVSVDLEPLGAVVLKFKA